MPGRFKVLSSTYRKIDVRTLTSNNTKKQPNFKNGQKM